MAQRPRPDWDPRSEEALQDQIAVYDEVRGRCPVAYSEYMGWSLFRHADVVRSLEDPESFSSEVSSHVSVPNGMDPPVHTRYRKIIDPYFGPEAMRDFEARCREIAADQVGRLPDGEAVEVMSGFAEAFALRIQCAFMGWPESLHEPLRQWVRRNHEATLSGDREALDSVATEFDGYIRELLRVRRELGDAAGDDVTTRLSRERVDERPLTEAEIVSILRNWTVGELGTISASIGILMHFLAVHADVQRLLRSSGESLPAAIDEILRIHAPLISNRRKTTRPVEIGGRRIEAGERVTLLWASANRDENVFEDPDEFRLDRDPDANLLYGKGIHLCPGAPLARLELRILMEEVLAQTEWVALAEGNAPVKASYPGSGFSTLALHIKRRSST